MYSRHFRGKPDWLSGVVKERSGTVSYCVKLDDNNCVIRRHQDHIRVKIDRDDVSNATDIEQSAVRDPAHSFDLPPAPLPELQQIDTPSQAVTAEETTTVKSPVRDVAKSVDRRYPTRDRRTPVYYKYCN